MTLSGYYSRFDAADLYDEWLFRAQKGLQSAELNEIQQAAFYRLRRIADSVFRDGQVIRGTDPYIDIDGQTIDCPEATLYLRGAMRDVAAATVALTMSGTERVGVFLLDETITEDDDATLRDPATNTRNYNEPGAARLRVTATWGKEGTGTGDFYPVYLIQDGYLIAQNPPPGNSLFMEALARYDRESNGNYIVEGLEVDFLELVGGANKFTVKNGVGNIRGYKVDKLVSTRLSYAEDPDLETVTAEPETFTEATGNPQVITLNRSPVDNIIEVVATLEKTVTITKGTTGGQDTLPDSSIVAIVDVDQGGTPYVSPTDWFLNGDLIDWSPGGAEPSPGSSYDVTYRYLDNITPTQVDLQAGTFTATGPVQGTLVLTDYQWKLPRIDRICMNANGQFVKLKGISSRYKVVAPTVPPDLLWLATLTHSWGVGPTVRNDGIHAIPFVQLERMREKVIDLLDLAALERLLRDLSSREPSAKRGVFVDPFIDDDMRDAGIAQDAASGGGILTLPIYSEAYVASAALNSSDQTLVSSDAVVVDQPLRTSTLSLPPVVTTPEYTEIPVLAKLTPAASRWLKPVSGTYPSVETMVVTKPGSEDDEKKILGRDRDEILPPDRKPKKKIRQQQINFLLRGFQNGETLTTVTFDGVAVTPTGSPDLVAGANGQIVGHFTIPDNVPPGLKEVTFTGDAGTYGIGRFVGDDSVPPRIERQTNVTPPPPTAEPVAQTFRLEAGRNVTAVDLWFMSKGTGAVTVQIRETENGLPTSAVISEALLEAADITTGAWTTVSLDRAVALPADVEFALVALTDDPANVLATAEVGKLDAAAGRVVTSQPYTVGNLLRSGNGETWAAETNADLTFRIKAGIFSPTTRVVEYGYLYQAAVTSITRSGATATVTAPSHGFTTGQKVLIFGANETEYNVAETVTVTDVDTFTYTVAGTPATPATGTIYAVVGDVSDVMVQAGVDLPSSSTSVEFLLELPDGTQIPGSANGRIRLSSLLNQPVLLKARLTGTTTESPFVFAGVTVLMGVQKSSATYVSRAFPCAASARVSVIYESVLPGSSSLTVEVQKSDLSWEAVGVDSTEVIEDAWIERQHVITSFTAGGTDARVRLTLSGSVSDRPKVRDLRVVVI